MNASLKPRFSSQACFRCHFFLPREAIKAELDLPLHVLEEAGTHASATALHARQKREAVDIFMLEKEEKMGGSWARHQLISVSKFVRQPPTRVDGNSTIGRLNCSRLDHISNSASADKTNHNFEIGAQGSAAIFCPPIRHAMSRYSFTKSENYLGHNKVELARNTSSAYMVWHEYTALK